MCTASRGGGSPRACMATLPVGGAGAATTRLLALREMGVDAPPHPVRGVASIGGLLSALLRHALDVVARRWKCQELCLFALSRNTGERRLERFSVSPADTTCRARGQP